MSSLQPQSTVAESRRRRASWRRQPLPQAIDLPESDHVLLRTEEVSAALRISAHTLNWWRRNGRGPDHITIEGWPRYRAGAIRAWLDAQTGGRGK